MADTPLYSSVEKMKEQIDLYFIDCEARSKPPTVPGLAYFLGFASRQSLFDYGQKPEFSYTISRAKIRIETARAETLVDPNLKNSNGIKFDLENNFGWKSKSEHEHFGEIQVKRMELPAKVEIGSPLDL